MILTCPYCRRSLSSSGEDDAPSFCMYCGHKLRDLPPDQKMQTLSYAPASDEFDDEVPFASERVPQSVGGYRLLRVLGTGGMGRVYEAESPSSGQRVAVKLLSSKLASSPTSLERFKQEGRLASQLAHPRCVFVLSADTDNGQPYIVMELMPGQTLKDVIESRGALPWEEAVLHILDVIDGLSEAHRLGMIHRDIKPSNCFLTADGRVKVGDFGLSKSLAETQDRHLTQSGAFLGTVLFASPEQIRGEPLDYGSDVYSVCSTLYYLLSGRAPYHHESATAALAKAISEDPPPLCDGRPGIPRGLERIVMKGLERARDRRWQSLDDLREALIDLLPSRRHPARPRMLVGAYALDRIVLAILTVPLELSVEWNGEGSDARSQIIAGRAVSISVMVAYFTFCEGLFGRTPGKWLLGLRVNRMGQTVAPGIPRAFGRAVAFYLLFFCAIDLPELLIDQLDAVSGGILAGASFLVASAGLLVQLRKKWGFRGLHDFATDCHVTQNPLPARKLRLAIQFPTPLHDLLPPPKEGLPKSVGGYAVRGRIAVDLSGEQVWVGEDASLSRLVLLWLRPPGRCSLSSGEAARPSRLRRLSGGTLVWGNSSYDWVAFAAPLGGPLDKAIDARSPLPWADARFLLEQLVEELRAAESDGTMPAALGIERVWAEPNGRLQLLDCSPANGISQRAHGPIQLLREVASLALEGRARSTPGSVRAPVPPHATPIVERLFADGGYANLAQLHRDLMDTQNNRPEVTPTVRGAQLGIQAATIGAWIAAMFLTTFCIGLFVAVDLAKRLGQIQLAQDALADPELRAKLATDSALERPLKSPNAPRRLAELRERMQAEARLRRAALFAPQRLILEQIEQHMPTNPEREASNTRAVRRLVIWAGAVEGTPRWKADSPWDFEEWEALLVPILLTLVMVFGAAVFRGGLSLLLAGIAIVRLDGRRATRRKCAVRAALIWLPIATLLTGSATLQVLAPERSYLAAGLWLVALVLLPVYVAIALRYPTRGPQDRLVGTCLVPS